MRAAVPLAFVTETAPALASMARPKRRSPRAGEGSFWARLRKLRGLKGLTQAELGHRVQLSNRMVPYFEIRIEELPVHDRKTIIEMIDAMADARRKAS